MNQNVGLDSDYSVNGVCRMGTKLKFQWGYEYRLDKRLNVGLFRKYRVVVLERRRNSGCHGKLFYHWQVPLHLSNHLNLLLDAEDIISKILLLIEIISK